MSTEPRDFREFYVFYLSEHQNSHCRRLHFTGLTLGLLCVVQACISRDGWWLLALPVLGYGLGWIGHFFFEKNRPASFRHPLYSLMGDFVMYRDMLIGKVPF